MVQEQYQRSMSKSSRHTRELARKLSKLTEVQAAVGWGLILLVIALLGVIYLSQSSKIAAVGRYAQDLQTELAVLKRENGDLERDIAQAQSITRLQKDAERLGFVKAHIEYTEYIVVPDYPTTETVSISEAQALAEPTAVESISEGFMLVIETRLKELMRGESSEQ